MSGLRGLYLRISILGSLSQVSIFGSLCPRVSIVVSLVPGFHLGVSVQGLYLGSLSQGLYRGVSVPGLILGSLSEGSPSWGLCLKVSILGSLSQGLILGSLSEGLYLRVSVSGVSILGSLSQGVLGTFSACLSPSPPKVTPHTCPRDQKPCTSALAISSISLSFCLLSVAIAPSIWTLDIDVGDTVTGVDIDVGDTVTGVDIGRHGRRKMADDDSAGKGLVGSFPRLGSRSMSAAAGGGRPLAARCGDFVNAGAKEMMTPSDVIAAADITFSCVSDPQVAKNMVFGNCGVLQEMSADKGYVEMTGIDAETSQDIAEAISGRGGRYLEAQVQGSKVQAEEGTLVILAAGDRTLFDDCQSCFQAMGKNSFYLGEVGNASKMNLVLQVMAGVTLAGLAEGMALADRAGLQQKDVMEIMELTSLACPLMIEKGKAIIEGGFPTHLPLQHMQKDLRLGMLMGDTLELPLPLTAATNEVFKHAKRLGYGEHDVSSVYIRTRF
ncbi:putative oxidoreductase GLYR1-like protein [Penaeus vannamei]|uniref:Putative oxidoreductase GLYR1-like protein n=1 Tax=Penaeus vannamei TaxID=6689 RepID=A0A423SFH2_PENVA|nr:putative oxidoreductase GLYR1-like protein [Penaeus vannamei]